MNILLDFKSPAASTRRARGIATTNEAPIRSEIFSTTLLEKHGAELAKTHQFIPGSSRGKNLTKRIQENEKKLHSSYQSIISCLQEKKSITPAAEWFIDNFHIVRDQFHDIRKHLPSRYYRQLPKLSNGHLTGYPRVYGIAWEFIAHSDSLFDLDLLKRFVSSYQSVQPLSMGELWAISITIRIVLLENLRRLSVMVVESQNDRRDADIISDEVLELGSVPSRPIDTIIRELKEYPLRRCVAVQLLHRLNFQDAKVAPILNWVGDHLAQDGLTIDQIVSQEHMVQAATNTSVRNIITSMRLISALDWRLFFEDVCLVEQILRQNTTYANMDFITRDRYRNALEELSKGSKSSELAIADAVTQKVKSIRELTAGDDNLFHEKQLDLGFHLISNGRYQFEKEIGFNVSLWHRILRILTRNATLFYLGSILSLALFFIFIISPHAIIFYLLAPFLTIEIAVAIVNHTAIRALRPRHLPRLELAEGVPATMRTFVVVPTMLNNEKDIIRSLRQLEVHYLTNPEGAVHFALLSDWKDSTSETLPTDASLLELMHRQVTELNRKYKVGEDGHQRFYILHRKRIWNECEQKWMGYERKRGKLHEFNRLLKGAKDTTFISNSFGSFNIPTDVRYVITLDADTKMPKGSVTRLVGTLAHPLNIARVDNKLKRVIDGYGILQPKITPSLPSASDNTIFQRLSSGPCGIDPYASTVSDVYQDLFAEGCYMGKGIYDVDVFEKSITDVIPENRVLSHDLFEGQFARCGFISDVELIEEFPSHCEVYLSRIHRWTRGDWQLLPWILGREGRRISLIGRWKMLENLRRSLTPAATLALFVAALIVPGNSTMPWFYLIGLHFALSPMIPFISEIFSINRRRHLAHYFSSLWRQIYSALGRIFFNILFLPHHTFILVDAVIRALYRMMISKQKLLEWTTAADATHAADHTLKGFFIKMSSVVLFSILLLLSVVYFHAEKILVTLPFFMIWMISPLIAWKISICPPACKHMSLDEQQVLLLRDSARKIWRFFQTFVTAEENHLPPDNFQEDPFPVIAHRTSPTNIGLYLLSTAAAHDFGWISLHEMMERLEATLHSMSNLPRFNGHFYNWYETTGPMALEPRYISSVDNGNLAGHLLALAQVCEEKLKNPVSPPNLMIGCQDALRLLKQQLNKLPNYRRALNVDSGQVTFAISDLEQLLLKPFEEITDKFQHWGQLKSTATTMVDIVETFINERGDKSDIEVVHWANLLASEIEGHGKDILLHTPLATIAPPIDDIFQHWKHIQMTLAQSIPLQQLPAHYLLIQNQITTYLKEAPIRHEDPFVQYLQRLLHLTTAAIKYSTTVIERLKSIESQCRKLFEDMNFNFLYDKTRKLFSIGYRVSDNSLDTGYYDLLASEARLLSFIAIARGDVPVDHWFHLGRSMKRVDNGSALISWSGSMFEYLMPSLVMDNPLSSLLETTEQSIVQEQINYGISRAVPWGVSESGYNLRNIHFTYQYSNFGVPGLGLKRSLEKDLVIAPYATFLAAMIDPEKSINNLEYLSSLKAEGIYGYYEALDYTPERIQTNETMAIVRSYMAHHQGMSLIAISNVIFNGNFRRRFHADPLVQSTELILQERPPHHVTDEMSWIPPQYTDSTKSDGKIIERRYHSPYLTIPRTQLLSNDQYMVMITTAGSGYSRFREFSINRWREDVTRDHWGSFIYLRDCHSQKVWSAGHQPTCAHADKYDVTFTEDRVRIQRLDGTMATRLEIYLSPEDNTEIRHLCLTNKGSQIREIEVTSYAEIVLNIQAADNAHPCFSNLFVQTEYISDITSLIATRRPRSEDEETIYMAHVIATDKHAVGEIEFETDRMRFIGRGRTTAFPISIGEGVSLSNTVGAVLDPIVSLRTKVRLAPGETAHVTYSTVVSLNREELLKTADKYRDVIHFDRASDLAWAQAQVTLQHLGIRHDEANLFQELANRIIYHDASLRPSSAIIKRNVRDVTGLWVHGISGDVPIVLVRIDNGEDRHLVKQLLRAYEYWCMKHLLVDLVILDESSSSYMQDLHHSLKIMVESAPCSAKSYSPKNKGKVFLLRADILTIQDIDLLKTAARIVLVARHGSLADQARRIRFRHERHQIRPIIPLIHRHANLPITPIPKMEFFNGLGGFAKNGREYVISLSKGQQTPTPWINVVANSEFGFHVSESGAGPTWSINGRENLITPWSNDPVCDTSGEGIYLLDRDSGELWTPTALPIRLEDARYVIRHGQGHSVFELNANGIRSELTQFVHWAEPVKISILVLKNLTNKKRRLLITGYAEWVLGFNRSNNVPYIITEVDEATNAVFAHNPWHPEFGSRISFATFVGGHDGLTCDRTEFLGRNGKLDAPFALTHRLPLSGKSGVAMDPCAAIQKDVYLDAYQEITVTFILGQSESREESRRIIELLTNETIAESLQKTHEEWDSLLQKIQVETPDPAMNIMLNRWLLYQTTVCRLWARAAFYQAGGAYGFRDQLQDSMSLIYVKPEITRAHILRAAARQFAEGDVQHWWHTPTGRGVRTHFSDDLLWLPFVVSFYLQVTQDQSILDETVPFLNGPPLLPDQEDSYYTPEVSTEVATIYEHCARTLDRSMPVGSHGLPLIGTGDWNDGMNRVGHQGKGESVWLAWFLQTNLHAFIPLAKMRDDLERFHRWTIHSASLKAAVEKEGWDGAWYRRAYFDDGTPLGSNMNDACRIDSLSQSWAVLSKMADPERMERSMQSVEDFLVKIPDQLVLLLAPPFDKTALNPGYIKGYLPGVRENGGQYTHAAIWCLMALAQLGKGEKAVELFSLLNPVNHGSTRAGVHRYKVEPYVVAADVYSQVPYVGRGGWTWYTGAAGWMYRAGVESILGLQLTGNKLELWPCIHPQWKQYKIHYRYESSIYEIEVLNENGKTGGPGKWYLDGRPLQEQQTFIELQNDGVKHHVRVELL